MTMAEEKKNDTFFDWLCIRHEAWLVTLTDEEKKRINTDDPDKNLLELSKMLNNEAEQTGH